MRSIYGTIWLLFSVFTLNATTRKVLFIGNSYTYTNTMPSMLQTFAAAKGDTLIFNQSDPGGYTLEEHSVYAPTLALIFSQPWDLVVLQEQSELPAFPPAQVDTQVYPYAHILDSLILANDSCTQVMFMMTWGHADGDPANCLFFPDICTYDGMQQRLRESYLQMTHDNNAIVAPVGAAWQVVRDSFPALWLYQSDSIHPDMEGSYLQTCVLYASIFHKHTYGSSYLAGLSSSDANTLQHFADKVTLDSLTQWQQYGHYPDAGFTFALSGNVATFAGQDSIQVTNNWSFGDTVSDTSANPLHSYGHNGNYCVKHTVENNCFMETQADTVRLSNLNVNNNTSDNCHPILIMQNGNHHVTITTSGINSYDWLDVYSSDGREIGHYPFNHDKITVQLIPGIYLYRAYSYDKEIFTIDRFAVY